ncbi:hypothetical protein J3B00_003075 [Pseudomonas sp. BP8]|nr:hypothetical protein [Pseudomonas sp. BP8]
MIKPFPFDYTYDQCSPKAIADQNHWGACQIKFT